jgi:hypothetical protein
LKREASLFRRRRRYAVAARRSSIY